jgi:hypothetical protein
VSASIDSLSTVTPVCPRGNPTTGTVRDHADWAALVLPFNHTFSGAAGGQSRAWRPRGGIGLVGDHQRCAEEFGPPYGP